LAVTTGNPIAATVAVDAAAARALGRLAVDAFLKIQAQQEATDRLTQEGPEAWTRDEMRMLITQLDQPPHRIVVAGKPVCQVLIEQAAGK
jgi:hypothetical protein